MSQIKLEKLTSEQKALISVYQQKWRNIALSTEPINRPKASEAIKAAYTLIGEKEPEILFFDSPYLASKELEDLSFTQLDNDDLIYKLRVIPSRCDEELFGQLQEMHRLLEDGLQEKLYADGVYVPDEFQVGYRQPDLACTECSWLDFYISELKIEHDPILWEVYQGVIKHCGWICTYQEVCLICERPTKLSFDNQQRLHREGSPAIQYADCFSLYAYHGIRLPEKYGQLPPHQWCSQWLLSETNAELRRVLIEGMSAKISGE